MGKKSFWLQFVKSLTLFYKFELNSVYVYYSVQIGLHSELIQPWCRYRSTGHQLKRQPKDYAKLIYRDHTATMRPHFLINTYYLHLFSL